jgi:hypothetical protein
MFYNSFLLNKLKQKFTFREKEIAYINKFSLAYSSLDGCGENNDKRLALIGLEHSQL